MQNQRQICERFNVEPHPCLDSEKVGISLEVKQGILPINGLRLPPLGETSGWYIWAGGEMSQASDFFSPLHIAHLHEWSLLIIPYLSLPPGWRFQLSPDHEDVWFDENLLT